MFLRRLVTLVSAAALAVSLSIALAGTARADLPPDPNWNEIFAPFDHNFNNTLCIDDGGNAHAGAQLILWHCASNANQRWHFVFYANSNPAIDGGNSYSIELDSTVGSSNPLCITFPDLSNEVRGQRLVLGSCNTLDALWTMLGAPGTNPLMNLRSYVNGQDSGLCMMQPDFSDNNGTPLIEDFCADTLAETWQLG